jgi:snRNA-activating protein complex subunit 1
MLNMLGPDIMESPNLYFPFKILSVSITYLIYHNSACFFFVFFTEANKAVDVQNIQHISDDREFIGDEVERITENWNVQRQVFYQQTGLNQRHAQKDEQQQQPQHKKHEQQDDDFGDEFSHQLELQLIEEEQLQQKEEDDESNHELEL